MEPGQGAGVKPTEQTLKECLAPAVTGHWAPTPGALAGRGRRPRQPTEPDLDEGCSPTH